MSTDSRFSRPLPSPGRAAPRRTRTRWTAPLLLALAGPVMAASCRSDSPAGAPVPEAHGTALRAQDGTRGTAESRRRAELARSRDFHLLLDLGRSELVLQYGAAVLAEFPVLETEVGVRRGLLGVAAPETSGIHTVWSDVTIRPLRPRRTVMHHAPAPGERPEAVIPPTPEEALPAPDVWRLTSREGLLVEIVAVSEVGAPLRERGWRRWLPELGLGRGDPRTRLRVEMFAPDAGRLYRGLPDTLRVLVLTASPSVHQGQAVRSPVRSGGKDAVS